MTALLQVLRLKTVLPRVGCSSKGLCAAIAASRCSVHNQCFGALQAVRPENVVLEVCRSRTAIIYDQEPQPGSDHVVEPNSMSLRSAAAPRTQSCVMK